MIVGYFLGVNKPSTKSSRKRLYLYLVVLILGLTSGFRGISVAYDTVAYKQIFIRASGTWNQLFHNTQYVEIGFAVLCSLVKIFGGSFQTLLIICSLFTVGSVAIFIYRHSDNILLSVFLIVAFPYYYHSFDILRYYLAMSFVLLGYQYVEKEKPLRYFIYVAIGSLFHSLIIVFALFYYIPKIKWNNLTMSLTIIAAIIGMQFLDPLSRFLSIIIGKNVDTGWVNNYAGGIKTMVMYGFLALMALFLYRYNNEELSNKKAVAMSNVLLLFVLSFVFIRAAMAIRLMLMFMPFMAVGFPTLMSGPTTNIQIHNNKIIQFGIVIIGLAYHSFMMIENYQNIVPYIPFWR